LTIKFINKKNINPQVGLLYINEHRMEEQDTIHLPLPGYTGWFMITVGDDIPGLSDLKKSVSTCVRFWTVTEL